jgi:hypothetical protein
MPNIVTRLVSRQHHHKLRATALAVLTLHVATMALHDGAHQRQTQANTAFALARTGQAVEGLEDAFA